MWKQIGALLLCSAATVRGVPVLPADTRLDPAASASSSNLEVRNAALEAKLEGAKAQADLEVKLAKAEANTAKAEAETKLAKSEAKNEAYESKMLAMKAEAKLALLESKLGAPTA